MHLAEGRKAVCSIRLFCEAAGMCAWLVSGIVRSTDCSKAYVEKVRMIKACTNTTECPTVGQGQGVKTEAESNSITQAHRQFFLL